MKKNLYPTFLDQWFLQLDVAKRKMNKHEYIKHIPGGKRYWKVGNLYQTKITLKLYDSPVEIIPVGNKLHRKTNQRWITNLPKEILIVKKYTNFLLINPPNYMIGPLNLINVDNFYQLKVFVNQQVGYFLINKYVSPKIYCSQTL